VSFPPTAVIPMLLPHPWGAGTRSGDTVLILHAMRHGVIRLMLAFTLDYGMCREHAHGHLLCDLFLIFDLRFIVRRKRLRDLAQ